MIDSHVHLNKRFYKELPKVKIDKVILAASNLEESEENLKLAGENNKFFAAIGIHPQQTDPENSDSIDIQIDKLDRLATEKRKRLVAVGECGLDYSPVPPGEKERTRKDQERLFRGQIAVALKHGLPLIIHARKAVDEVIEILGEYHKARGVFHCYTGGKKRINKILDLGEDWYFGFDGNLTYEEGLPEVVAGLPKDRILLETDSPLLAPLPYRGKKNQPDYVKYIYLKLAGIWKVELAETERVVDNNAKKLFDIRQ